MIAVHIFRWACAVVGGVYLFLALLAITPDPNLPPTRPEYAVTGFEIAFVLLTVWALLTVLTRRAAS